jgi:putative IMPACT (imprinted ancient) family translation regulator
MTREELHKLTSLNELGGAEMAKFSERQRLALRMAMQLQDLADHARAQAELVVADEDYSGGLWRLEIAVRAKSAAAQDQIQALGRSTKRR